MDDICKACRESTEEEFEATMEYLENEIERLHGALSELVRLKRLKETHGRTEEYLACREKAWERAEEVLGGGETNA